MKILNFEFFLSMKNNSVFKSSMVGFFTLAFLYDFYMCLFFNGIKALRLIPICFRHNMT